MLKLGRLYKNHHSLLWSGVAVFLFSLFVSRSLFSLQMPRTDDGEYHGARIASYYLGFKQGQLPVYWAGNFNYGFGYPVFLFAYPLANIMAAFFYAAGANVELSTNLVVILSVLSSGLGMFSLSYLLTKKPWVALASGLIFVSSPYLLLNFFYRYALGEITFIAVLPWVLVLLKLRKKATEWWYLLLWPVVAGAFILSHQASLVVGIPLILIWLLLDAWGKELKAWRRKRVMLLIGLSLVSVLLTAWFWLPFLWEKQYIVVDSHWLVTEFWTRYPNLGKLLWSGWQLSRTQLSAAGHRFPLTLGVGILTIIAVAVARLIWLLRKGWGSVDRRSWFWLGVVIVAIFLMTPASMWIWQVSRVLPYLQFPWRLLWLAVLASLMVFNSKLVQGVDKRLMTGLVAVLIAVSLQHAWVYARPESYISNPDLDWGEYFGTTASADELRPKWFDRHANLDLTKKVALRVPGTSYKAAHPQIDGLEEAEILSWTGSAMKYQVEVSQPMEVIQKTAYFPGWQVWVDDQPAQILFEDKEYPGRLIFRVEAGSHLVESRFTNQTPARQIGIVLTVVGLMAWLGLARLKQLK